MQSKDEVLTGLGVITACCNNYNREGKLRQRMKQVSRLPVGTKDRNAAERNILAHRKEICDTSYWKAS